MSNSTLVTSVTVHMPSEVMHRNDVPVRVEPTDARHVTIEFTTRDLGVTVRLTHAEVVSFIELLGGRVS